MKSRRAVLLSIAAVVGVAVLVLACRPVVHTVVSGSLTLRYQLVSTQRVDRTHFAYTYSATLENVGSQLAGLTASASSTAAATLLADGEVSFPSMPTGAIENGLDTFTIIQDRAAPFDPSSLVWSLDAWTTDASPQADFAVTVPAGWSAVHYSADPNVLDLLPLGAQAVPREGYVGDIVVALKANPTGASLDAFYTLPGEIDLFANSASTTRFQTRAGYQAIKFSGVPGFIETTIVSVHLPTGILEITDVASSHGTDGLLDAIAADAVSQ